MAKLEVTKTIEARKLNKRSRLAMAEPPVTIPYGAILDQVVENGDYVEFTYIGDLFQCKSEVLRPASHALGGSAPAAVPAVAAAAAVAGPKFIWETIRTNSGPLSRAKVPGGWLVGSNEGEGRSITFMPDQEHTWDGTTLD
jgi:hypothetical protein